MDAQLNVGYSFQLTHYYTLSIIKFILSSSLNRHKGPPKLCLDYHSLNTWFNLSQRFILLVSVLGAPPNHTPLNKQARKACLPSSNTPYLRNPNPLNVTPLSYPKTLGKRIARMKPPSFCHTSLPYIIQFDTQETHKNSNHTLHTSSHYHCCNNVDFVLHFMMSRATLILYYHASMWTH